MMLRLYFTCINTGVIQKVLPVLSTETLLHIWLSTEYYGFRPSSTTVDTGDTRGLMMSKLFFLGIFCYFTFRICFKDILLSCEKRRQAIVSQVFI